MLCKTVVEGERTVLSPGEDASLFYSLLLINTTICLLTYCVFPSTINQKLFFKDKELETKLWTTPTVATLTEVTFTVN